MKKKLLLFASMLMLLPFMVSAAKTVGVKVAVVDPDQEATSRDGWDWDFNDVYFYVANGNGYDVIAATPETYEVSGDTVWYVADAIPANTPFFLADGENIDFSKWPSLRSQELSLKKSAAYLMSMAPDSVLSETDPTTWYTILTQTVDPNPPFDGEPELEPAYDPSNFLSEDQFNYNNNDVNGWYYAGWNNAGKVSSEKPGFGESEACLVFSTTSLSGDAWGAQALLALGTEIPAGQYTISFYAKADNADAEIQFGIKNNAGWPDTYEMYTDAVTILTTDWVRYEYTIDTDKPVMNMELNHGHALGKVYVDALEFKPTVEPENPATNALDDNQYNYNNGELNGWKYESWNNKGTAKVGDCGYARSKGCLVLNTEALQGDAWGAQVLFPMNQVLPAGEYTLKFYAKADDADAEIQFGVKNTAGWPNTYEIYTEELTHPSSNWRPYTYKFTTTEETSIIEINHGHALGNVYIDCISIIDVVEPRYKENNVLTIDEFNYNNGQTNGWRYEMWNNKGTVNVTAPGFMNSAYSLVLHTDELSGDAWGAQTLLNLPKEIPAGEYKLTFYAMAENTENSEIQFGVKNSAGWPDTYESYAPIINLTDSWKRYEFTITTSKATSIMEINHGHALGNVYIDCIELLEPKQDEPEFNEEDAIEGNMLDSLNAYFNIYEDGDYLEWHPFGVNAPSREIVTPGWDNTKYALSATNTIEGMAYDSQLALYVYDLNPYSYYFDPRYDYTISFMAKADTAASMVLTLEHDGSPWFGDVCDQVFELGTEWKSFEVTMRPSEYGLTLLMFNIGATATTYYFDHIGITRTYAYDVDENVENNMLQGDDFNFDGLTTGNWKVVDGEAAGELSVMEFAEGDFFNAPGMLHFVPSRFGAIYASQIYIENEFKKDYTYDFTMVAAYVGLYEFGTVQVSFQPLSKPWYGDLYPQVFQLNSGYFSLINGSVKISGEENTCFVLSLGEYPGDYLIDHVIITETDPSGLIRKPTGIEKNEIENNSVIYNTLGQRVNNPVKGQVYMMNGKKVLF